MSLPDEFSAERRAFIIEALSWAEDDDGRIGYERAKDMLEAHDYEQTDRIRSAVNRVLMTRHDVKPDALWVTVPAASILAALDVDAAS